MIIFGHRLYGRVDQLSNGWYVATRFLHVDYVPLVPVGSFLVTATNGSQMNAVPLPLRWRSLAMTYLWVVGLLGVLVLVASFLGGVARPDRSVLDTIRMLAIGAVMVGGWAAALVFWRKASPAREADLLTLLEGRVGRSRPRPSPAATAGAARRRPMPAVAAPIPIEPDRPMPMPTRRR